jgi:hypothetical protein
MTIPLLILVSSLFIGYVIGLLIGVTWVYCKEPKESDPYNEILKDKENNE